MTEPTPASDQPAGEAVPISLDAVATHFRKRALAAERRVEELNGESLLLAVAVREQQHRIAALQVELESHNG